jgi:hypothetical protein
MKATEMNFQCGTNQTHLLKSLDDIRKKNGIIKYRQIVINNRILRALKSDSNSVAQWGF